MPPTLHRMSSNRLAIRKVQRGLLMMLSKLRQRGHLKQDQMLRAVQNPKHRSPLHLKLGHRAPQVTRVLHQRQRLNLPRPNRHTNRCPQRRSQLGHLLVTGHNRRPSTRRNALTNWTLFLLRLDECLALCGDLHLQ